MPSVGLAQVDLYFSVTEDDEVRYWMTGMSAIETFSLASVQWSGSVLTSPYIEIMAISSIGARSLYMYEIDAYTDALHG